MKPQRSRQALILATLIGFILLGCGGGGGTGGSGGSSGAGQTPGTIIGGSLTSLAWDPPTTFTDNVVMDPYRDLSYYEIYLRSDANFTDFDVPVAQVAAVTNVLNADGVVVRQELTNQFALSNLLPYVQEGAVNYIRIKSVSVEGTRSEFSSVVTWDLT